MGTKEFKSFYKSIRIEFRYFFVGIWNTFFGYGLFFLLDTFFNNYLSKEIISSIRKMCFKYWEECPCVPAMLFPCAGTIYFVAGEDPDEKKFVSTEKTYFCRSGIGEKI